MTKSIGFKLLMLVGIYVLFLFSGAKIDQLLIENSSILKNILQFSSSCILAYCSYFLVKTTNITEDKIKTSKNTKIWLIIFGIIMLLFLLIVINVPRNIKEIFNGDSNLFLSSFFVAGEAGIFEEFLVRVLGFSVFLEIFKSNKYSLVWASISSSLLFGVLHLSNLTSQSFDATIQQIFYATVLGLCLAVIRIRFNGISYAVILHFLIDFHPTIAEGTSESSSWGSLLLIFMPIAIVSFICLMQLNKDNNSTPLLGVHN